MNALGPEEREALLRQGAEVAQVLARHAARYDAAGTFPVDSFEALKAAGLLGTMVPRAHGGIGSDFSAYTRLMEVLGRGDAATALTFNMHNIILGALAEVDTGDLKGRRVEAMLAFQRWAFQQAVTERKVFASATSEPGVGATYRQLQTRYRKVENGFVLNGTKSFVSMAGYADYYVVAARLEGSDGGGAAVPWLSYLVVERDNPGVRFESNWDVMGMRATSSHTMHLTDCFVPRERLFLASEGMVFTKLIRAPHWQVGGYNGVYLGISSAAFDFAVGYLRSKKIPGTDRPLSTDRLVQHQMGALDVKLAAARALTLHAAECVDRAPATAETNAAIHRAKYAVSELGPELCSEVIRICGGGAIARRLPLERYYRDARCGGLMPARSDDCLLYAGKAALGLDVLDPQESSF